MAVELYLKRCKEKYDFIFMDPPFPYKFRKELIETAGKRHMLNPGGKLLIHYPEEDALPDQIGNLVLTDKRIYGRSIVNFYEYKEDKMDKIDICIGVLNQYIEKIGEKEYEKEAVKTILNNNIEAQQEKEKILKKLEDEKKAKEQILALIEQDKIDRALKAKFSK